MKELYKLLIYVSCLDKCNIYMDFLGIVMIGVKEVLFLMVEMFYLGCF